MEKSTSFAADAVPLAPEDPLFGMMAAFRRDEFEQKVDLGIGAYRDNNAKPWVLPVVKKVLERGPYQQKTCTNPFIGRRPTQIRPKP